MFTLSNFLEHYRERQVLKSVAGYLSRSVERASGLVSDLPQAIREQEKQQRNRRNAQHDNAEEPGVLPFPDRRKRNIPVLLDTRSKKTPTNAEMSPMVDITV